MRFPPPAPPPPATRRGCAAADVTATTGAPGGSRLHNAYVFDKLSPATQAVCQPASW